MYSFFGALCPSGCIARNASRRPHVEKLWNAFIPFSSLSHTRYQQKDDWPDHRCSLRQHNVWDILGWRILNMITTHGATESIWCWWINYYPRVGVFAAALERKGGRKQYCPHRRFSYNVCPEGSNLCFFLREKVYEDVPLIEGIIKLWSQ